MKNILLITYYFPPYSHPGNQRTLKFSKYLPYFGYHPIILTCGNMPWRNFDFEVYKNCVQDKMELYKINAPRFKSLGVSGLKSPLRDKLILRVETLLFEDRFDWAFGTRKEAIDLSKTCKADLIYTTGPPHSVHFLGYYIKKKTGLPWVVDFRDPMVNHWPGWMSSKFKQFIQVLRNRTLFFIYERILINAADYVITATDPMTDDFKFLHPRAATKLFTITNGYDEDDFKDVRPKIRNPAKMNIVYTGRFWAHQPANFLRGLKIALQRKPSLRNELEVTFIGEYEKKLNDLFNSAEFCGAIKSPGPMNHRESIAHQLGSDINLLIIPGENRGGNYIYTGKIFEYLRAQRPILAIVPPGIGRDLIEHNKLGFTVDPNNHEGIAGLICHLHESWKKESLKPFPLPDKLAKKFARKNLTKDLAKLFDKCLQ